MPTEITGGHDEQEVVKTMPPTSVKQDTVPGARSGETVGDKGSDQGAAEMKTSRRWPEILIAAFTGCLVLLTGVYAFVSWRLWQETSKSVELTRRSVEATERALALTEESNRLTRAGIDESRRLGEESNRLTSASLAVSKRSIEATERALQATERSYLTVARMELVQAEPGKQLVVATSIENSGRITAKIGAIEITSSVVPEAQPRFVFSSIGPGKNRTLRTGFDFEPTVEWVEQLKAGQKSLFIWGRITYADALGSGYLLPICSRYVPESHGGDFMACERVPDDS